MKNLMHTTHKWCNEAVNFYRSAAVLFNAAFSVRVCACVCRA